MRAVLYWIADKLFARELNDAYEMGIREGVDSMNRRVGLVIAAAIEESNKTQARGIEVLAERLKQNGIG